MSQDFTKEELTKFRCMTYARCAKIYYDFARQNWYYCDNFELYDNNKNRSKYESAVK